MNILRHAKTTQQLRNNPEQQENPEDQSDSYTRPLQQIPQSQRLHSDNINQSQLDDNTIELIFQNGDSIDGAMEEKYGDGLEEDTPNIIRQVPVKSLTLTHKINKPLLHQDPTLSPDISTGLHTVPERQKTNKTAEEKRDSLSQLNQEKDISGSVEINKLQTKKQSSYQSMPSRQLKSYVSGQNDQKVQSQHKTMNGKIYEKLYRFFQSDSFKDLKLEQPTEHLYKCEILDSLRSTLTPLDTQRILQAIVLPNYPDYCLVVKLCRIGVFPADEANFVKFDQDYKPREGDPDNPRKELIKDILENTKNSKHREFQDFIFRDGKAVRMKNETVHKENEEFLLFQLVMDEIVQAQWVLNGYNLEYYDYMSSNNYFMRTSLDNTADQKLYFFAKRKDQNDMTVFVMEQYNLKNQHGSSARWLKLEEFSQQYVVKNIDLTWEGWIEVVKNDLIWYFCYLNEDWEEQKIVLVQELKQGCSDKQRAYILKAEDNMKQVCLKSTQSNLDLVLIEEQDMTEPVIISLNDFVDFSSEINNAKLGKLYRALCTEQVFLKQIVDRIQNLNSYTYTQSATKQFFAEILPFKQSKLSFVKSQRSLVQQSDQQEGSLVELQEIRTSQSKSTALQDSQICIEEQTSVFIDFLYSDDKVWICDGLHLAKDQSYYFLLVNAEDIDRSYLPDQMYNFENFRHKKFSFETKFQIDEKDLKSAQVNLFNLCQETLTCIVRFSQDSQEQVCFVKAYISHVNESAAQNPSHTEQINEENFQRNPLIIEQKITKKSLYYQLNSVRENHIQYPVSISTVFWDKSVIRMLCLDLDYPQIQLHFQGFQVVFISDQQIEPFKVHVLLQDKKTPTQMRVATVELGYNTQPADDLVKNLFDVLHESKQNKPTFVIKNVTERRINSFNYNLTPIVKFTNTKSSLLIQTENQVFLLKVSDFERDQQCLELQTVDSLKNYKVALPIDANFDNYACVCIDEKQNQKMMMCIDQNNFSPCEVYEIPNDKRVLKMFYNEQEDWFEFNLSDQTILKKEGLLQNNDNSIGDIIYRTDNSLLYFSKQGNYLTLKILSTQQTVGQDQLVQLAIDRIESVKKVKGVDRIQIIFNYKDNDGQSNRYSYIVQYFDSSEFQLQSRNFIDSFDGDSYNIDTVNFCNQKCIIQVKQHLFIYDCVTAMLLQYFELPSKEHFILNTYCKSMQIGDKKYRFDPSQDTPKPDEFQVSEKENVLFFDTLTCKIQTICLADQSDCVSKNSQQPDQNQIQEKPKIQLKYSDRLESLNCQITQHETVDARQIQSTKNYIIWNTESKIYFFRLSKVVQDFTKQYEKNNCLPEPILEEIDIQKLTANKCTGVKVLTKYQKLQVVMDIDLNKAFQRQDIVKIQLDTCSLIWDLQDNEEIKKNNIQSINRCCKYHASETNLKYFSSNYNDTIVAFKQDNKFIVCKQYSTLDLYWMKYLIDNTQAKAEDFKAIKSILTCKIRNRTYFSLTDKKEYNDQIEELVNFLLPKGNTNNTQNDDKNFMNQILACLLYKYYEQIDIEEELSHKPTKAAVNSKKGYKKFLSSLFDDNKMDKPYNVLERQIKDNDPKRFRSLLKLVLATDEMKHGHIINHLDHVDKLLQISCPEVKQFLKKGFIQTAETKKIKTLLSFEENQIVTFTSNTTLLNQKEIQRRFQSNIDKPKRLRLLLLRVFGKKLSDFLKYYIVLPFLKCITGITMLKKYEEATKITQSYDVYILEIEWLQDGIPSFLGNTVQSQEHFDNDLIQMLVNELDYSWSLKTFIFAPFSLYMAALIFYYCFYLTDASDTAGQGFLVGQRTEVALRFFVLFLTAYFVFLEIIQIKQEPRKYYLGLIQNLAGIFMLGVNLWIITEHATNFFNITPIRLSQAASIVIIQLWYYFFYWLRIFDQTAIYVMLIQQVVWNTRYFMIMVVIIISAFSFATFVLDRQMVEQTDDEYQTYDSIIDFRFNSYLMNTLLGQYMFVFNLGNTSNYNESPNRQLLWCYFIIQTFLVQITFLNMLINVMATTYDNIISLEARNKLIMRTEIYSEYVGYLNMIESDKPNKFNKRYMYIARKPLEESSNDTEIMKISKLVQDNIDKNSKNMKNLETNQKEIQSQLHDIKETQVKLQDETDKKIEQIDTKIEAMMELLRKIANEQAIQNQVTSF